LPSVLVGEAVGDGQLAVTLKTSGRPERVVQDEGGAERQLV